MADRVNDAALAEAFLRYLRDAFQQPSLAFAEAPVPLSGGFDTAVYGFRVFGATAETARPLVLRVFAPRDDPTRARYEAAVQGHVTAQGFPAPRVLLTCIDPAVLGSAFMVMERLPGETMLHEVSHPARLVLHLPRIMAQVPRTLAQLQSLLHALEPGPLLAELHDAGLSPYGVSLDRWLDGIATTIEQSDLDDLKPVLQWLVDRRPGADVARVICHGDLHPLNILMHDTEVAGVIDWSNTTLAPREFEIGHTLVTLRLGPADVPAVLSPVAEWVRRSLATRYVAAYAGRHPIDGAAVEYYEVLVCLYELMRVRVHRLTGGGTVPPPPYASPQASGGLAARIAAICGLTPSASSQ